MTYLPSGSERPSKRVVPESVWDSPSALHWAKPEGKQWKGAVSAWLACSAAREVGAGHAIPAQVDPCVCLEGMSLPRLKSVNSIGSFSSGIEERRKGAVNGPWVFFVFLPLVLSACLAFFALPVFLCLLACLMLFCLALSFLMRSAEPMLWLMLSWRALRPIISRCVLMLLPRSLLFTPTGAQAGGGIMIWQSNARVAKLYRGFACRTADSCDVSGCEGQRWRRYLSASNLSDLFVFTRTC